MVTDKVYDQREDLYEVNKRKAGEPPRDSQQSWQKRQNSFCRVNALSAFLDALDEWGCNDNAERAKEILKFIESGSDLSAYMVK